jgi:hypothetical protein
MFRSFQKSLFERSFELNLPHEIAEINPAPKEI